MVDANGLTEAKTWSPQQLQFQVWLASPPSERQPTTQHAFAREVGVHPVTLSEWKRLPGWGSAVYTLAHALLENDLVPILHAQAREARRGSLPHAQWLFDLAGKWSPKHRLEHTGAGGAPLSLTHEFDYGTYQAQFAGLLSSRAAELTVAGADGALESLDSAHPNGAPGVLADGPPA